MRTKVSICIPTYEQPDGLRRVLESICIQTFTDYEIVISDDSTDNSVEEVANHYRDTLPIRYQRNCPAKGSPENWNEAIRLATGDYIKILHHDDWFSHERSLEEFVRLLDENPVADLAFGASVFHFPDGDECPVHRPSERQLASLSRDPRILFCDNFVGPPSATIFRSTQTFCFDPALIWVVDIDFYIRIMSGKCVFAYCNEPLVNITNGQPNQLTAQCLADSALQVREYTYLYRKITRNRAFNCRLFNHLSSIFCRHRVRYTRNIISCGVCEPVPFILKVALLHSWILRAYRFVVRGFRWITRQLEEF